MKNKLQIIPLLVAMVLLLSACSLQTSPKTAPNQETDNQQLTPTPTISEENSLKTIEADLKSTVILDEDFSDLE